MIPSKRPRRFATALLCAGQLAGCSSLPTAGPSNDQVVSQFTKAQNPLDAHLVDLTAPVVQTLRSQPQRSLTIINRLRSNRPVDQLGPGDVLTVTIFEAGNGLFSPHRDNDANNTAGSSAQTLPHLQVDRNGMVTVPYAGDIRVAGHTTTEIQRMIEERLADKTAQPQVLVSLVSNGANVVYVSGDVKNPGRYSLTLAGETLLDMVALAGGPTHSPQDTVIKVNRRGREASTSLTRVQNIEAENIPVQPGDRIQVDYLPRTYLAFGATGRVAQLQFDAATVSLAEAIARVGGLDDNRANPEAVFLFRFEDQADAKALGLSGPQFGPVTAVPVPGAIPGGVPVVYRVDMRDPSTYFLFQQFAMQDKDIIYIANAPTVQIYKFLQLIYTFATPAITAKTLTN